MLEWTMIALAAVTIGVAPSTGCDRTPDLRCERGAAVGDLGIDALRCDCTVTARTGRRSWSFRDAPEVLSVDPDGPAAGRLQPGDIVTALDGTAITEADAGQRFANLAPGQTVRLTVRRAGVERTVEITPAAICPEDPDGLEHATPQVSLPAGGGAAASPVPPTAPLPPVPPVPPTIPTSWFGLGLQCRHCGWEQETGEPVVWEFSAHPVVYRVDPGGPAAEAGIRTGDTLLQIDGVDVTTAEGGRRFGAVLPGDEARLTVGRAGTRHTVAVVPRGAPSAPPASTATPAPESPRNPRYQGTVGTAEVEVLGTGSVIVNVPAPGREVEIVTGDATIRIRAPEADR